MCCCDTGSGGSVFRDDRNRDRRDVQAAFLRVARLPPPAPCPAVFARTDRTRAGLAADARITARMQRIDRHVERLEVRPHIGFGPVRERIELRDVARAVMLFFMQLGTRYRLLATL